MITIKFEIRNNMWGKTKNQIRNILDENKLYLLNKLYFVIL